MASYGVRLHCAIIGTTSQEPRRFAAAFTLACTSGKSSQRDSPPDPIVGEHRQTMAHLEGFEPPTASSEVWCSTRNGCNDIAVLLGAFASVIPVQRRSRSHHNRNIHWQRTRSRQGFS